MAILVTGGAGFIGSAVAAALLDRGDGVVVLDAFDETLCGRAEKERNLAWLTSHGRFALVEGDLRDRRVLDDLFRRHAPERVVHLAALAGVRPSIQDAARYHDVNVSGTARLLEIARAHGVTSLAMASSSSVYGGSEAIPFAETDPVDRPPSPYAASKRAMELAAAAHVTAHGGDVSCLRLFTVYGPRQRSDMAIHTFMRLLAAGHAVPMFGDGTSARDYTFVDDVVTGILAALDQGRGFRIHNLGSGHATPLRELIDLLGTIVGVVPQVRRRPDRPGDARVTQADLRRARAELGYAPLVPLEEGLRAMWAWMAGTETVAS